MGNRSEPISLNLLDIRNFCNDALPKRTPDIWYGLSQNFYICCCVTVASPLQFFLSSLNANWTQQKYLVKVVLYRPAKTERELQWFKTSFQLPDSFITNSYSLIPKKEQWSYRRRAISNKQCSKIQQHSSSSTEQLGR